MKTLQVRIRKARRSDVDRIVDIERSWHHLSHWSIDSYYRLLSDDTFTMWWGTGDYKSISGTGTSTTVGDSNNSDVVLRYKLG